MQTFAIGKGQFIESRDQIKAEEGVLKKHWLNYKKKIAIFTKLS